MKKVVLILLLFATVFFSGCAYFNTFYNAKRAFKEKQYELSKEKCKKIVANPKWKTLHDDAYFLLGEIALESGDYSEAFYYFSKIKEEFSDSKYYLSAVNKMIFLLKREKRYNDAYLLVKKLLSKKNAEGLYETYAEILYKLKYKKEFSAFVRNKKIKNPVILAFYYHLFDEDDKVFVQIDKIKNQEIVKKLVKQFYFEKPNKKYFSLLKHYFPKHQFLEKLFSSKSDYITLVEENENINTLSFYEQLLLYKSLFHFYLNREKLNAAKYALLKYKEILKKDQTNRDNFIYTFSATEDFKKYTKLPENWKYVLFNGRNYFLFTDKFEFYRLNSQNEWEVKNSVNFPKEFPKNAIILRDNWNKRWIFVDFSKREWQTFNDKYEWDTIKLEGDELSRVPKENIFIFDKKIVFFYGLDKIAVLTLGKDIFSVKEKYIDGYIPPINGYKIIPFVLQKTLFILGGKNGDLYNYTGYYLNPFDDELKWKDAIVKNNKDLSSYGLKSFQYLSQRILMAFDKVKDNKPVALFYLIFDKKEKVFYLEDTKPLPHLPDNIFEYNFLDKKFNKFSFYYKNNDISYNDLILLEVRFNLQTKKKVVLNNNKRKGNLDTDGLMMDLSVSDMNNLLALYRDKNMNYRHIADIYLADFGMYKLALKYYKLYLKNNPHDVDVLYAIFYINYRYLNKMDEAKKYLKILSSMEINDKNIKENIKKFKKKIKS